MFWAALLWSVLAHAQSDIVHFENIGRENGIAQSTISGIVQGNEGFMWFATAEGLHRFDGYEFKIFKHDLRDTSSLANNYITSLYEDSRGYLWIGTYTGQLDRFDKSTYEFKHFRFLDQSGSENKYQVNCISEDQSGHLLVGLDGGGVMVYDTTTHTWSSFSAENSILPNNYVRSFSKEANGLGIWIGTLQGIILYNKGKFKSFRSLDLFRNQAINDVLHHRSKLFVVTNGQGLQVWDTKTDQVVPIESPRIRGANFTTFVKRDNDGNLWIGTDGAGVMKFTGDRYVTYTNNPYNYQSIIGDKVRVGYMDHQGAMWFGCINGISKYDPTMRVFNLYKNFEYNGKVYNNILYSIYESRDGTIWLGTLGSGLAEFNPKTESLKMHPSIKDGDVETRAVRSIYEDRQGTLWIGSRDEGLFSLNRETGEFTHHPAQKSEINVKTIRHIMEDSDGKLWLATRWGLAQYDRETHKYIVYRSGYLTNNPIYQILENKHRDELILVTFRTGLHIFNKKQKSFTVLQHSEEDSTSPSVNAMMCIEEIAPDSFMIGTYGGGINIFDRKALKFSAITTQDGLPNDVVYGILKGDGNSYWISTNDGFAEFDMNARTFRSYGLIHYLQGLEFNEGAYWKARDGTLYFGGQNGFNYFKPSEIKRTSVNTAPPRVVLTSFKKLNKPVDLGVDINHKEEVRLSHNENLISFGFAALSYSNTKENQYMYMLEGFDNEWIRSGTRREAYYTYLSPGEYTFRVKAANHLGIWSVNDCSIKVIVEPAYWQTWWFKTMIGLGVLGIIGLVFWQRTRSITRDYQHKLVDLELKALRSQMNPHFIFNSLNSIQYFVLKNEPKAAYTYLTKFSSLMRMILQNSRVKYITLQEEYDWLYTYLDLEKLRMEGQLDFSITISDDLQKDKTYVPSMLIQPYLENAIIHGLLPKPDNRKVTVDFSKHNNRLKCVIEDNGIGRKRSAELNESRTKKHKSQGIKLTGERLEIITQDLSETPEFFILDLYDEDGNAAGTRVTLFLPIVTKLKEADA